MRISHRTLIDATRSWKHERKPDWDGRRFPPIKTIPEPLAGQVKRRWGEYGIGIEYLNDAGHEALTPAELSRPFPEV